MRSINFPDDFVVFRSKIGGGQVLRLPLPPKLSRDDVRRLHAFLLSQVDDDPVAVVRAPSLIEQHMGPDLAAMLAAIDDAGETAVVAFSPTFAEPPTCRVEPISNIADKASIERDLHRDLKPGNVIVVEPPPETGPAAETVLVKPRGGVVDQAKSIDAFRAAADERRERLAREAVRAKERLAASRGRAQEIAARASTRLHAKPAGQRPPAPVDRTTPGELPTPRATFTVEGGVVR